MVDVGWLPGMTLWGTTSAGVPSPATSSAVRPKARALVWAKQLAISRSWRSPSSWVEVANPMKSAGMSRVPWWINWWIAARCAAWPG